FSGCSKPPEVIAAGERVSRRASAPRTTSARHFRCIDPVEPATPGFLAPDVVAVMDVWSGAGECAGIVGRRHRRVAVPEPDHTKCTGAHDGGHGPEAPVAKCRTRRCRAALLPFSPIAAHQTWRPPI